MKAYFCGLIFVVCPEHVIIVAYYLRLLFKCPDFRVTIRMSRFSWVNFPFEALRSEIKPNEKSLLYGIVCTVSERYKLFFPVFPTGSGYVKDYLTGSQYYYKVQWMGKWRYLAGLLPAMFFVSNMYLYVHTVNMCIL